MNIVLQMLFFSLILAVAFIRVFLSEHTFDFSAVKAFNNSNSNTWLFILFFTGFGLKAFFILLAIVVYLIRITFTRKLINTVYLTWECGYDAPKSKIQYQYTGKSFSKAVGKIPGVIIFEKKKFRELDNLEVFPAERKHLSKYVDFFENMIIKKINDRLLFFMNLFQFVQNGQTQMYIMHGLLFIILLFLGSLFSLI